MIKILKQLVISSFIAVTLVSTNITFASGDTTKSEATKHKGVDKLHQMMDYANNEEIQGVGFLVNLEKYDPADPPKYSGAEKCELVKSWLKAIDPERASDCLYYQSKNGKGDAIFALIRDAKPVIFAPSQRKELMPKIAEMARTIWLDKK